MNTHSPDVDVLGPGLWLRKGAGRSVPHSRPRDIGCLLVITLLMVLYPFEHDTGRSNFSLGDTIVLVVSVIYAFRALRLPVPLPRYTAYALTLVLVGVASTTVNAVRLEPFFTGARASLVETLKLVMATFWMCVIFWLLSRRFARRFVQLGSVSVLFATVAALGSISLTVTGVTDARPTGPFENANLYAGYLSFNVFLALATQDVLKGYLAPERGPGSRAARVLGAILLFGCLPLLLVGIVSTGSRGGLMGLAAGVALSGVCRPRSLTLRRAVALMGVLAVAWSALQWYVRQEPLVLRRLTNTAEGDPKGVEERLMLWQAAREAFGSHPLLGVGYGQFRNYAHIATGENKVAHETYLSIAAELGVAGLIVFGCLLAAVLRDTLHPVRHRYAGVTRATRGYVIAALVQGLFANVQHSRALWICLGVIAVQVAVATSYRVLPRLGPEIDVPVWRHP
jgi:O-antigen ligase